MSNLNSSTQATPRTFSPLKASSLLKEGADPLLARVLASRGLSSMSKLKGGLRDILHHSQLKDSDKAAKFLLEAIEGENHLIVVADYDCDGATACAVALRGLRAFGAKISFVVPDRMVHGYGLTPGVVELVLERFPDAYALITVDNGIASFEGVEAANSEGLKVLVTDHHLPVEGGLLPDAACIVNPVQPECGFPSKALAGVGVIWYILWSLQDLLRSKGHTISPEQRVSNLLPLVAVGTVADVVPLDENNRILVQAGLNRIREGKSFPGIDALAVVGFGNRTRIEELVTTDIAFGIGPRINAAGRLETMDVGIECLTTNDYEKAQELSRELNTINQQRKDIELGMVNEAVEQAQKLIESNTLSIVVHGDEWHQGVIGIVAGRIKEEHWRPTFVLSTDPVTGEIKGSGRSIPGFNLKDTLDQVHKAVPGVLLRFGGHAMAAGVTIAPGAAEQFKEALEAQTKKHIDRSILSEVIEHDGSLSVVQINEATYRTLSLAPWGQGFLEPSFKDEFEIKSAKLAGVSKDQLQLRLSREGIEFEAIKFRHVGPTPKGVVDIVYKLNLKYDKWGNASVTLLIDHIL